MSSSQSRAIKNYRSRLSKRGLARFEVLGTLNSSVTTSQYGFDNELNFNPSGASLNNVYALVNGPTISGRAPSR